MTLSRGQNVTVLSSGGTCQATVIDVAVPETLHEVLGTNLGKAVTQLLQELEIDEIAQLEHVHSGNRFYALHNEKRGWLDLRREHLTITQQSMGAAS